METSPKNWIPQTVYNEIVCDFSSSLTISMCNCFDVYACTKNGNLSSSFFMLSLEFVQMFQYLLCSFVLQSLKKVRKDPTVLPICITVLLSYLPEAGQYSSFFLYLRQVNVGVFTSY